MTVVRCVTWPSKSMQLPHSSLPSIAEYSRGIERSGRIVDAFSTPRRSVNSK